VLQNFAGNEKNYTQFSIHTHTHTQPLTTYKWHSKQHSVTTQCLPWRMTAAISVKLFNKYTFTFTTQLSRVIDINTHSTGWVKKVILQEILPLLCQILTDFRNSFTAGKILHLQQRPCNSSHHTLNMLLHYLGKWEEFKFAANLEDNANEMYWFYMHPFQRILLNHLLLTYLLRQFMVPVKYSFKY